MGKPGDKKSDHIKQKEGQGIGVDGGGRVTSFSCLPWTEGFPGTKDFLVLKQGKSWAKWDKLAPPALRRSGDGLRRSSKFQKARKNRVSRAKSWTTLVPLF